MSEYLEVKNLDKYQHYKDRNMIWFKWYVDALQDYRFSKLTDSQKWLFIGIICLACKSDNHVPHDPEWIRKQISNSKSISKDIAILVDVGLLSTCYQDAMPIRCIEDTTKSIGIADGYADFEQSAVDSWNVFCEQHPFLSKVIQLSEKRKQHLKARRVETSFDMAKILSFIKQQPFLLGKSEKGWRVSFDWIIKNDENYIKVLELKYLQPVKEKIF